MALGTVRTRALLHDIRAADGMTSVNEAAGAVRDWMYALTVDEASVLARALADLAGTQTDPDAYERCLFAITVLADDGLLDPETLRLMAALPGRGDIAVEEYVADLRQLVADLDGAAGA